MRLRASILAMGFAAFASGNAIADLVPAATQSTGEQAIINQFGNGNNAAVDQQTSSYDVVSVLQSSNGASATVTSKSGGGNRTSIIQTTLSGGSESASTATVTQDGAFNAKNAVLQVGNNHEATITHSDSKSDSNQIGQVGSNNTATVTQTRTSGNFVGVDQGTSRSAGQVSGARAEVNETDTVGNGVQISQGLSNGYAYVEINRFGGNNIAIQQVGGSTDARVYQSAETGDNINIYQGGTEMAVVHANNGGDNRTNISQVGAGEFNVASINQNEAFNNRVDIGQTGFGSNVAYVTQANGESNDHTYVN